MASPQDSAVEGLKLREEILQICYWYQGEGLGDTFAPHSVIAFLQADAASVAATFAELARDGDLQPAGRAFAFTPEGKRRAARMFTEGFTDFQQPGHGECVDGCCEGDQPCNADHTNCTPKSLWEKRPKQSLVCK